MTFFLAGNDHWTTAWEAGRTSSSSTRFNSGRLDRAFILDGQDGGSSVPDATAGRRQIIYPLPTGNHLWIHFVWGQNDNNNDDGDWMSFRRNGSQIAFADILDGNMSLNLNGSVTGSITNTTNARVNVDIHFYVAGATLHAELFSNGTKVGSTATRALSTLGLPDCFWFYSFDLTTQYISEIVVSDEDTRDLAMYAARPEGAGNYTAWDGTFDDVDNVWVHGGVDGGTPRYNSFESSVHTATADARVSFAHNLDTRDAAVTDTHDGLFVKSLVQCSPTATLDTFNHFLRIGSTDYDGPTHTIDDRVAWITSFWATNPATGNKWTRAELDALEIGLKAA